MISLTRLNGKPIMLNALLIETIEETPDTMISLVNGKKIIVLETVPEVVASVQQYVQSVGMVGATLKSLDTEGS
ncbi:flagellar FlbD family protein [Paenibacillus sp. YYML68]|uniref:flagellar FlbD family protein n=1 Tax=Paenibacillus sp. YYML68 TaxID=2909250 RepID=UPI00249259DF|nr:flagellar FlbD family protein [Paenibacillus sp. YYML68]